jgi:hypothetical protein
MDYVAKYAKYLHSFSIARAARERKPRRILVPDCDERESNSGRETLEGAPPGNYSEDESMSGLVMDAEVWVSDDAPPSNGSEPVPTESLELFGETGKLGNCQYPGTDLATAKRQAGLHKLCRA